MGALDVIPLPGYPGKWARRCVVEAWLAAGSPAVLWAGRTKKQQRALYNLWRAGEGNAADNPDGNTRMPHVRGMALDLADSSPSTAVVKAMSKAGFTRPIWERYGYSQDEPWHFELSAYVPIIRRVPLVTDAPKPGQVAGGGGTVFTPPKPPVKPEPTPIDEEEEDDMPKNSGVATQRSTDKVWMYLVFNYGSGLGHEFNSGSANPIDGTTVDGIARAFDTTPWAKVSESHYNVIKRSLNKVAEINVNVS